MTLLTGPNHTDGEELQPHLSPCYSGSPSLSLERSENIPVASSNTSAEVDTVGDLVSQSFTGPSTPIPYAQISSETVGRDSVYDTSSSRTESFDFYVEPREASFLLLEFRTQMAAQLPFVVIPDAASQSLRRERPMLWKAIMTAASVHDPLRQEVLGRKLMEEFSTRLLLRGEKSLDLLQALLVHITVSTHWQ